MQTNINQGRQSKSDEELEEEIKSDVQALNYDKTSPSKISRAVQEHKTKMKSIGYENMNPVLRIGADILIGYGLLEPDYMHKKARAAAEKAGVDLENLIDECDMERDKANARLTDLSDRMERTRNVFENISEYLGRKNVKVAELDQEYREIGKGNKKDGRTCQGVKKEIDAINILILEKERVRLEASTELQYVKEVRIQLKNDIAVYDKHRAELSKMLYTEVKPRITKGATTTNIGKIYQRTSEIISTGGNALQTYSMQVQQINEANDTLTKKLYDTNSLSMGCQPNTYSSSDITGGEDIQRENQRRMQSHLDKGTQIIEEMKSLGPDF